MRWYVWLRLPYAAVSALLAARGINVDPSTVFDGVQQFTPLYRFTPLYKEAACPHRRRVGARWSIDETYSRIAGRWC